MTTTTKQTFWMMVAFAAVLLLPDLALAGASGGTPVEAVLCKIVGWLTGTTGKAIATIAIVIIGIGALMGKVSWGMAIIVGIGVAIVFGAESLVEMLADGNDDGNCEDVTDFG